MADADPAAFSEQETGAVPGPAQDRRRRMLAGVGAVVALGGLIYGGWYVAVGRYHITTDNAYVGADVATVTPMVAGQVIEVKVGDTRQVKQGDVLLRIDDSDARIALAEAEAALAQARRKYGQTAATSDALAAQVDARAADIRRAEAELAAAQANHERARIDLERRQRLAGNGAVSGEELTSATNAFAAAEANLALARAGIAQARSSRVAATGELSANDALVRGTTATTAPEVRAAEARVAKARLDLERTVIRAPIGGVVTRRNVQVGQRIAAGASVMLIVPLDRLFVDANFKEGQLGRVKVGQKATLTADLYGDDVTYTGTVVGLSGGTGSSFALIPAQNATGNWIKVIQRLPVRIALDPGQLKEHPLRVGLSMEADIDTADD